MQVVLSTDWNSTTRMAVMETMKREFMRAHPNVTVEVDYFTSASSLGGSADPTEAWTLNDKQMIMGDHQQRHKAFSDWSRAVRAELLKALNGENAPKPALQAAMDAGDRVLAAST